MKPSANILFAGLLGAACTFRRASAQLPVTCTKSKNNGDILLYGNADSVGGWIELYSSNRRQLRARDLVVTAGATFDLMFEMDCDAPSRRFDFTVTDAANAVVESFTDQEIGYTHYISSAIDHSIFSMNPVGPFVEGEYRYCVTSKVGGKEEATKCGTLKSMEDSEDPVLTLASTEPAGTVAPGTSVNFNFRVSDDTVLDRLSGYANGEYITSKGLKTRNYKIYPSEGVPRDVTVTYQIPSKGKVAPVNFRFLLCDDTNKCVEENVTVNVEKEGGGGGGGKPNKL